MIAVTVKLLTGEEKKGNVLSVNFNQPVFYLQTEGEEGKTETQTIQMNSVKAILFPKRFKEDELQVRTETIDKSIFAGTHAFRLTVEFMDGEIMNGSTNRYNPNENGFYLVPLNPADKNERVYINARAVKRVDSKRLLGKILVDQKKISAAQLDEALRIQKEKKEKKIGTILKEENIITDYQLRESLGKQKEKTKLLGEILLEAGYITSEQLEYALSIQQENRKKRLGQILVELKYITPNDICIVLATQFHLPWIDLANVKIPPEIVSLLPEQIERSLEVIPLERKGTNMLVVAVSQPQDPLIVPEISRHTALKTELIIAYEGYIASALNYSLSQKEQL